MGVLYPASDTDKCYAVDLTVCIVGGDASGHFSMANQTSNAGRALRWWYDWSQEVHFRRAGI